ncbi:esterase/lipase family protein [Gordonia shandongensis]|uniref:esterase/lipase family protein n=1 Tax=Gordonia shandongensis TaxID=376351 RepID=UPI0012EBE32A|nr:alpha/beta fold hydrolase [Gordonia shandongensis]
MLRTVTSPGWSPPGANDYNCKLNPDHPNPVVLVNGTTGSGWEWMAGSPFLRNEGFCVYHFNYGNVTTSSRMPFQSLAGIRKSAMDLKAGVDRIRARTGAARVDLVGWSQGGGMTPHYYINFLGGSKAVDTLVGIVPGNHGTSGSSLIYARDLFPPLGKFGFDLLNSLAPAFPQQAEYSPLVDKIYQNGDTRPGVRYVSIATQYDQIVTPYTNAFLSGGDSKNILLQEGCNKDRSEHLSVVYNRRAWMYVSNELHRVSKSQSVPCISVDPYFPNVGR